MESISIERFTIPGDAESMDAVISEVRKGLMSKQNSLASWLFYDDAGPALFEEITAPPKYCVSATSTHLRRCARYWRTLGSVHNQWKDEGEWNAVTLAAPVRRD
jgi:hypothetical protein